MVADLNIRTEIVVVPTVRETDGLAMSSRNAYLSPVERAAAPVVFLALEAARAAWMVGERHADVLRGRMLDVLEREPLAQVEYVSIANPLTLAELDQIEGGALVSLAVRLGRTRLIDNIMLTHPGLA
jgi:pantoate--beta-alanine ligase